MTLLEQTKLLISLSDSTKDALLELLIQKTKDEVLLYTNKTEYLETMDNVVIDIVVIKYNRIGSEGLASQSYSGASESYLTEYPDYINKQLNTFKKKVLFL